jgi:hypothetical protein
MERAMKTSAMHPGQFLKAEDVNDKANVATMSSVEMEMVGQGRDQKEKPVLHFEGQTKPMVLNKTNTQAIEEAFGDESDEWAGHKIKIYCAKVDFGGKKVDGIRVQPIVPKPALKDDLNDEIPL